MDFDSKADDLLIRDIRWAILTVARYIPWKNVCRHQAYQAMMLCRFYRQPYHIYIGFKKNPETALIDGHAWTMVEDTFITGFCNPEEYVVQSSYP